MNRLLHKSPAAVFIDGIGYEINTSHRDCIATLLQLKNNEWTNEEKAVILINNMYLDDPPDPEQAIEQALWFLRCGDDPDNKNDKPCVDFEQDSAYIYSAFIKSGVDLNAAEDMHWWTFMSRFSELPECFLTQLISWRSKINRGEKLTKDEQKAINRVGWDVVTIKQPLTKEEQEIEKMFMMS